MQLNLISFGKSLFHADTNNNDDDDNNNNDNNIAKSNVDREQAFRHNIDLRGTECFPGEVGQSFYLY